jgi:hypothetical protein
MITTASKKAWKKLTFLFFGVSIILFFFSKDTKIFADDAGFMSMFKEVGTKNLLMGVLNYVPGRNLHILWQDLAFAITSTEVAHFWQYRLLQTIVFSAIALIVSLIVFSQNQRIIPASITGLFVCFFPIYQEVLWWPSALPMHLFSTLFILLMLYIFQTCKPFALKMLLINLFAVFAIFTYDQSAAVAFAFLGYVILIEFRKFREQRISPTWLALESLLFTVLALCYAFLVLGRNGNGPVLDGNSAVRFAKNLVLPLTYSWSKSQLITLTLLLAVLIGVVFKWRLMNGYARAMVKTELGKKYIDYLPKKERSFPPRLLFMLSFIAYIPTALWYVSPRHLYLPMVLFMLGIGSLPIDRVNKFRLRTSISVCILCLILFVAFTYQIQQSQEFKSQVRSDAYLNVDAQLAEKEKSKCIYIQPQNEWTKMLFRYEMTNPALAFFTGNESYYSPNCQTALSLELLLTENCAAFVSGQQESPKWMIFVETEFMNGSPRFSKSPTCK